MLSEEHEVAADGQLCLACFQVRGRSLGLDVTYVREVVRWQTITPLPMAPPMIEGVIELRGRVFPVVDLGRLLDGAPVEAGPDSRIALLEFDGMSLGLCVDAATDVLSVHPSAVEDVPELARQAGYEAIRAVVRRSDAEPLMVIALDQILEKIYRQAIDQVGATA